MTTQLRNMTAAETFISETSARELASAILKQAAEDLRRFHGAKSPIERELYLDAQSWVSSDVCSWPFSFLNVCQLLNRVPEDLRQELLSDASVGLFNHLARRGKRAARSLPSFFSRIFTRSSNPTAVDSVPLTHVPLA